MVDSKPDFTTIKFSPDCEIGEISRVALASILRIHQIDPAVVSELAVAMQQEINALLSKDSWIEIEFHPSGNKISVEIRTNGGSRSINAAW